MNICVLGWHLSEDVCTPPEAQARQDWAALPSSGHISSQWPLHYHWELCGVPGSDCKEPGCDTGWPAILFCQHCSDNRLLEINLPQHQEDMSVPHLRGGAGSGPGSHLLQLTPGWCACACDPTFVAHPECNSPTGLQPKFPLTTLLLRSLHCLQVVAWIQFKLLVLTYCAANGSGPSYIQDMVNMQQVDVFIWFLQVLGCIHMFECMYCK